jgi:predicted TPR repeat methyltransferase
MSSHSLETLKFHYSRAKQSMLASDFETAKTAFLCLLEIQPDYGLFHYNLASCYVELKHWGLAYRHYGLALRLEVDLASDSDLYFNLGVCAERLGLLAEAQDFYQKAVSYKPGFVEGLFNLGLVAAKRGSTELAIETFESAKRVLGLASSAEGEVAQRNEADGWGENSLLTEINFHLARLDSAKIPKPPTSHVKALFDQYADHYEEHMVNKLSYTLPEIMADYIFKYGLNKLKPLCEISEKPPLKILDLGCGTGLMAQALINKSPQKLEIHGVDLSPNMLELAREKGVYQSVSCEDILDYLNTACESKQWDGVMAADVLNYFGDLSDLFQKVKRALRPGGWFCFSVEAVDFGFLSPLVGKTDSAPKEGIREGELVEGETGWILQSTGRYAHNQNYVKKVIENAQIQLINQEGFKGRAEGGEKVLQRVFWVNH